MDNRLVVISENTKTNFVKMKIICAYHSNQFHFIRNLYAYDCSTDLFKKCYYFMQSTGALDSNVSCGQWHSYGTRAITTAQDL